jgi:hypothetical protein
MISSWWGVDPKFALRNASIYGEEDCIIRYEVMVDGDNEGLFRTIATCTDLDDAQEIVGILAAHCEQVLAEIKEELGRE